MYVHTHTHTHIHTRNSCRPPEGFDGTASTASSTDAIAGVASKFQGGGGGGEGGGEAGEEETAVECLAEENIDEEETGREAAVQAGGSEDFDVVEEEEAAPGLGVVEVPRQAGPQIQSVVQASSEQEEVWRHSGEVVADGQGGEGDPGDDPSDFHGQMDAGTDAPPSAAGEGSQVGSKATPTHEEQADGTPGGSLAVDARVGEESSERDRGRRLEERAQRAVMMEEAEVFREEADALVQLRDMGFHDADHNTELLRAHSNDLAAVIQVLAESTGGTGDGESSGEGSARVDEVPDVSALVNDKTQGFQETTSKDGPRQAQRVSSRKRTRSLRLDVPKSAKVLLGISARAEVDSGEGEEELMHAQESERSEDGECQTREISSTCEAERPAKRRAAQSAQDFLFASKLQQERYKGAVKRERERDVGDKESKSARLRRAGAVPCGRANFDHHGPLPKATHVAKEMSPEIVRRWPLAPSSAGVMVGCVPVDEEGIPSLGAGNDAAARSGPSIGVRPLLRAVAVACDEEIVGQEAGAGGMTQPLTALHCSHVNSEIPASAVLSAPGTVTELVCTGNVSYKIGDTVEAWHKVGRYDRRTCAYARMHSCTHAHMHACAHAHMHTCTHARMHACACAHAHTRTHPCT